MIYIIKIDSGGYFGNRPWQSVKKENAKVFNTIKQARIQLNRLRGRVGYPLAEIEIISK